MRVKSFKLENGKLRYLGTKEVEPGDAVILGDTPMIEVQADVEVLSLREASTSDFPMYFKTEPAPPTEAELARARQAVKADKERQGREALAKSYRDGHPNATPSEVNAFAQGRNPDPEPDSLEASIKRIHPNWTDEQVEIFKKGR